MVFEMLDRKFGIRVGKVVKVCLVYALDNFGSDGREIWRG